MWPSASAEAGTGAPVAVLLMAPCRWLWPECWRNCGWTPPYNRSHGNFDLAPGGLVRGSIADPDRLCRPAIQLDESSQILVQPAEWRRFGHPCLHCFPPISDWVCSTRSHVDDHQYVCADQGLESH